MKTANLTVRHELILISDMFVLKGATRHGEAPFLFASHGGFGDEGEM